MASLLGETVFEISGQGPSPTKDFFQLVVTKIEVIWRWWKISLRSEFRNMPPGELKQCHQDFLHDFSLQNQVSVVFGAKILEFTQSLCEGHFNYLERLPDSLLLRIMAFLELKEVLQLRGTSHRFKKLCDSEEFWEQTVRDHCDTVNPDMEALANTMGWKKMFFTNKLQLQKHISRRRLREDNADSRSTDTSCLLVSC